MKPTSGPAAMRPGDPGYRAASAALFLTALVTFALLYSTQPLLPLLAQSFHLGAAVVSLSVSLGTAGLTVGLPLWGAFAERYGRRAAILAALIAATTLTPLLALSRSFALLAALRFLQGMAIAGVPATAMTYLGEEIIPSALGSAMGLYIAGNSIGGMSGRLIIGVAADAFGWQWSLVGLGLFSLVLSIAAARLLPPSRRFRPQARSLPRALHDIFALLPRRDLLPLYLIGGLLTASFVAVYNYLGFLLVSPAYGLRLGTASLVYLFYVLGSLGSYTLGRLADRVGRGRIFAASVLLTLGAALVTLLPQLPLKLFGVALFTFGFFAGHSAASTLVSLRAGAGRGGASTLYLLVFYLGSSVGGSVIGLLWQTLNWPGVVLGTTVMLVPAALLALPFARERET